MSEVFVCDVCDDGLVVMPLREAQRLAKLNEALELSSTWGEFYAQVSDDRDTVAYLRERYDDDLPAVDRPFDADELCAEGDWPVWPKQAMLEWLPPSVQDLGTVNDTLITGSFLHLDEGRQDEVIEMFEAEGIECREDRDNLVVRACGEWRYT
jgi:hypothetical protein